MAKRNNHNPSVSKGTALNPTGASEGISLNPTSVLEGISLNPAGASDGISLNPTSVLEGISLNAGISHASPQQFNEPTFGSGSIKPSGIADGNSVKGHSVSYGISSGFDRFVPIIRLRGYRFFPKDWSYKQYRYKEGMMIIDDDSIIKCSPYHYFLGGCISFYQDIFECFEKGEEDAILAEVESCGYAVNVEGMVYTNRLIINKEVFLSDIWSMNTERTVIRNEHDA